MRTQLTFTLLILAWGCTTSPAPTSSAEHVMTLRFGADDNSEVIKLLPAGDRAVLIASKARKLTLLAVDPTGLAELQSVFLFPDDSTESELTHIDFDAAGRFAAITRTLPITTGGMVTDCQGEVVFVDLEPGDAFGTVLKTLAVGAMPDAVDISGDDRWAVTADEVDYNDGKCPVAAVSGSISIIELPDGDPTRARLRAQIHMSDAPDGGRREPEQVIFAPDGDRVAVTLQDTHEVLFFSRSALVGDDPEQVLHHALDAVTVTPYPRRDDGAEPWPDGVQCFVDGSGEVHFVAAGEYNDTLAFFDITGGFEGQVRLASADFPADLPRNLESGSFAPFRPDSLAVLDVDGQAWLAASLKHAGAIGVWDVSDGIPSGPFAVIKVGYTDTGTPETESSLGTEGIAAGISAGRPVVLTANERESSVSLVRINPR